MPCPADLVCQVCDKHDVAADKTGWTQAYRQDTLATPAAAPDLVHGVAIASPALAYRLRKAGVFAGRVAVSSEVSA